MALSTKTLVAAEVQRVLAFGWLAIASLCLRLVRLSCLLVLSILSALALNVFLELGLDLGLIRSECCGSARERLLQIIIFLSLGISSLGNLLLVCFLFLPELLESGDVVLLLLVKGLGLAHSLVCLREVGVESVQLLLPLAVLLVEGGGVARLLFLLLVISLLLLILLLLLIVVGLVLSEFFLSFLKELLFLGGGLKHLSLGLALVSIFGVILIILVLEVFLLILFVCLLILLAPRFFGTIVCCRSAGNIDC